MPETQTPTAIRTPESLPNDTNPEAEGDPSHPRHSEYLTDLGACTYSAASVAGIAIDILRTHLGEEFFDLTDDTLGRLIDRLAAHQMAGRTVPGLDDFIEELRSHRELRNDLLHALPVLYGLHRRTKRDRSRVRNFYTIESLRTTCEEFERVRSIGSRILYFDGGAAVKASYRR